MALPLIGDPEHHENRDMKSAEAIKKLLCTFSSFSMRGFPPWPESESDEMSLRERSLGRRGGLKVGVQINDFPKNCASGASEA